MPIKKQEQDTESTLSWDEIFEKKPNREYNLKKAAHGKGGASVQSIKAKVDWAVHNGTHLTEATFSEVDKETKSTRQRAIQKASSQVAQWASCS